MDVYIVDAASCAIVKFLEIESTEELSNGWMLLCTVNLLSMGTDSLIDSMTVASLPSTLVKCLYLFFDLPDSEHPDTLQPGCEFTPREGRVLLQKVFVQVGSSSELSISACSTCLLDLAKCCLSGYTCKSSSTVTKWLYTLMALRQIIWPSDCAVILAIYFRLKCYVLEAVVLRQILDLIAWIIISVVALH